MIDITTKEHFIYQNRSAAYYLPHAHHQHDQTQ